MSSESTSSKYMDADLFKAAAKGNFEPFKNYPQGLDYLLSGRTKNTILHVHLNSPCDRSKDFVEKVLQKCPQLLWQVNNDGDVPLHFAGKYDHLEIVKLLIDEVKKPIHRDLEIGEEEPVRRMLRLRNKQHETALHLAIRGNFLDVVKEMLEKEDPNYSYTANKCGESPLFIAVIYEFEDMAFEILRKFMSPDCSGPQGTTVFHAAASLQYIYNPSWFDMLFSKLGKSVNQADESGWTPLHYAACSGNSVVARRILETDQHSAYATDKERNRTALHLASCRGNIGVMKEIIDKFPDCCEITDDRGWNVLHYAAISTYEEAIEIILKDPSWAYLINGQDRKGYTPLHLLDASGRNASVLYWFLNGKSAVPQKFFEDGRHRVLFRLPDQEMLIFDDENRSKEIEEWMKDLGKSPSGRKIVRMKPREEIENEYQERVIPKLEKAKDSHLVVAALVATVTFAAALTVPGGYISDGNDSKLNGSPILRTNAAFKAFIIADAIAMVLSTSSVFIHFVMVFLGYKQRYYWLIRSAFWFLVLAMGAMVVAFVTGIYSVFTPSKELAIVTCAIGLMFFVYVFYASIRLIYNFIKRNLVQNRDDSTIDRIIRFLFFTPEYLVCGCFSRFLYEWSCKLS